METRANLKMSSFEFPAIYQFPPFFTKQVHEETLRKQLELWKDLILAYSENQRIFEIDLGQAESMVPFVNPAISRKASVEFIQNILESMAKSGQAELVNPKSSKYLIYWQKPSEWAHHIYSFMEETGQIGSITTVYDLFHGDDTSGRPFAQLPQVLWSRVFGILEKEKKVALFGLGENSAMDGISAETGLKFSA